MLPRDRIHPRLALAAMLLAAWCGAAYAATVRTQPRNDYQRILFEFGNPTRMQVAQGGSSVTLAFSRPITGSIDSIQSQLGPYVKNATLSGDKKSLTLNLTNSYRVRQFISGDTVGVDLLTSTPTVDSLQSPPPVPALKPVAPTSLLETKPTDAPITSTEAAKPAIVKPITTTKPAAPLPPTTTDAPPVNAVVTTAPSPAPPVTTTQPAPEAAPLSTTSPLEKNKPATPVAAAPPAPLLTTKPAEPAAPIVPEEAPQLTTKTAETGAEQPAPEATILSTVEAPASSEPVAAPQPTDEIEPEQAAAETKLPEPTPGAPFIVSAKQTKDGTTITFPWAERTAAAVFERGTDIWILFSREQQANTKLLTSVLPKQIVRVQQYRLNGATALRLSTDGSLHAAPSLEKGGYGWHILLSENRASASLEVPVLAQTNNNQRALLIQAFDAAAPLTFYDPTFGDRVVAIPTYENGRGVSAIRQFPDLTVLATAQGVAVTSPRDDLTITRDRSGATLSGKAPLNISASLPIYTPDNRPLPGLAAAADVLMPYNEWFVPPSEFYSQSNQRLQAITQASPALMPDAMMRMVELYMGQGMAAEAAGYLELIREQYPDYYRQHLLAVVQAASEFMQNHTADARRTLAAPELDASNEAAMWRSFIAVAGRNPANTIDRIQRETEAETEARRAAAADQAVEQQGEVPAEPAAAPVPVMAAAPLVFDYLKYNNRFIRHYPPRLRQQMALVAADAYMHNNQPEEAVKVFDTLSSDSILGPVQQVAEFTLATAAAKKGKGKEALVIYDRLMNQYEDLRTQAQAKYAATMLRYQDGTLDAAQAADALESLRLSWRGDRLQYDVLTSLAQIYKENKQYDATLRTWKNITETFPRGTETLEISGDMAQLFQELFLNGMADEMPPLKSLALFYEFRDLTPIGETGNQIIQKLADRLAAVDLLDRATQLLENQIKFRLSGEERSRVGARLALLYLLNKQPGEALSVLEITNYGEAELSLRQQRIRLGAKALADLGKYEDALSMLFSDDSSDAQTLRLDILWKMKDWPNVINQAEDILSARSNLTMPLNERETQVLLKLCLGYSFEGDGTQLRYLRDYYSGLLPDGPYKEIFTFLTNDTAPLDPEDFALVARQISHTEGFLDLFRKQIAAGNLSKTVK